jgi:hypothetical protein
MNDTYIRVLELARAHIVRGPGTDPLTTCPLCKRRARIPEGGDRCRACVLDAIDRVLGKRPEVRRWAREYDCCRDCGTTERPHWAHGYCANCLARAARSVA